MKSVFDAMDRRVRRWNQRKNIIKMLIDAGVPKCAVLNDKLKEFLSEECREPTQPKIAQDHEYPRMILKTQRP